MTDQPQPPVAQQFEVEIPPEVEAGTHADFTSIWHTADTFVFDFIALRRPPALESNPDTGETVYKIPTKVVTRVRVPPAQIFEIMKALEKQLSAWEAETAVSKSES